MRRPSKVFHVFEVTVRTAFRAVQLVAVYTVISKTRTTLMDRHNSAVLLKVLTKVNLAHLEASAG